MENQNRSKRSGSKFRYGGTIYPQRVGGAKTPPRIPTSRSTHPVTEVEPSRAVRHDVSLTRVTHARPAEDQARVLRPLIGHHVLVMYLDRAIRYATFVFALERDSTKEFYPLAPDFKIRVNADDHGWSLKPAQNHAYAPLCFVHKHSFYLRTELPDGLLELLERKHANDDLVELNVRLMHPAWASPCERRIIRVSPPRVF
ncbi:MAG TPA: hypothetical protein VMU11_01725 [Verrucomicrobiae bacterium]|nr:hypothetical protein [Verrucomicrobiae bacterium]